MNASIRAFFQRLFSSGLNVSGCLFMTRGNSSLVNTVAYGCNKCNKLEITPQIPYHLSINGGNEVIIVTIKGFDKLKEVLEFFKKHIDTENVLGN